MSLFERLKRRSKRPKTEAEKALEAELFMKRLTEEEKIFYWHEILNPLSQIRLGTKDEVADTNLLAEKILELVKYSSELHESVKQVISVLVLHLLYTWGKAMYHDANNWEGKNNIIPYGFPTVNNVLSLSQGLVLKEKEYDINDEIREVARPVTPCQIITHLMNNVYFDGYDDAYYLEKSFNDSYCLRKISYQDLEEIYALYYSDVFQIGPCHPWIFKTLMLLSYLKEKQLNNLFFYAFCALQKWVNEHPLPPTMIAPTYEEIMLWKYNRWRKNRSITFEKGDLINV